MKNTKRIISVMLVVLTLVAALVIGTVNTFAASSTGFDLSAKPGVPLDSVKGIPYGYIGDADLNGRITVKDATYIQKSVAKIVELNDNSMLLANVNFDANITIKDATAIQKYLAQITINEKVNHVIFAYKANLVNNVFENPGNNFITEGAVTVRPYKMYWSNGCLIADCYIINGTKNDLKNVSVDALSFSNAQGNMAKDTFSGAIIKSLPAGTHATWSFVFPSSAVNNYGADLSSYISTCSLSFR